MTPECAPEHLLSKVSPNLDRARAPYAEILLTRKEPQETGPAALAVHFPLLRAPASYSRFAPIHWGQSVPTGTRSSAG